MHKLVTLPSLLAVAIGLGACASKPNEQLEEARSAYTRLQSDPRSLELAALETQDAGNRLDKAEQAHNSNADTEKVNQLAYLARRSTEMAEQTVALRAAEQQLMNMDQQHAQVRLESREAQLQRSQAELQRREQEIRQLRESLDAKPTERGTLITFGDVLFDVNSAELKPSGRREIQKLADFLNRHQGRQVMIEGYTDSTGSAEHNQRLSERRAQAVERELIRMGVDPRRLVTRGYGQDFPVASNDSSSGRAMNRRVEVTIADDNRPVGPRSEQREGRPTGSMGGQGGMGGMGGQERPRMQPMTEEERRQHQQRMQDGRHDMRMMDQQR